MATLSLARPDVCIDARLAGPSPLLDWLASRWAMVFSHPQDFAQLDLEADRWLCVVRDALAAAQVAAVRVLIGDVRFASWIEQIDGADSILTLDGCGQRAAVEVGGGVDLLRRALTRAAPRFVMVVDESLNLRRTLSYAPGAALPSVLDVIATTARLRARASQSELPVPIAASVVVRLPPRPRGAANRRAAVR